VSIVKPLRECYFGEHRRSSSLEGTAMARWDDLPFARKESSKIAAGTVAAVVMTGMLFVILFAMLIAA